MPLVWSLTTDGTLVPFRIVRRGGDETRMFSGMNPLQVEPSGQARKKDERVPRESLVQEQAVQVIENIQVEVSPRREPPTSTPITMDLGGIQNLIIQEFMRIHGWIEQDLHKLRTLAHENKELSRQVEEETLRLLKTRSLGDADDEGRIVEEDLMLAEEFGRLDSAQLLRVQGTSRELQNVHSRLQALLNASRGASTATNLESRMQSMLLENLADVKPLSLDSSLQDIQTRLKQLSLATGHLRTRIDRLRGEYVPVDFAQVPAKGYHSPSTRELLKTKLLKRAVGITAVSEEAISVSPLPTSEPPKDLSTIRKVLSARNKAALTTMQTEEVAVVAEAPPIQDASIFKSLPSLSRPLSEGRSEASKGKDVSAVASTSSGEVRSDTTIPPSTILSFKDSETDSKAPLLPTTGTVPAFSLAPLPSPSTILTFSSGSMSLRSSETLSGSTHSKEHLKGAVPGAPLSRSPRETAERGELTSGTKTEGEHDSGETVVNHSEGNSMRIEARMSVPPIPKLFDMIRRKEQVEETTHKDKDVPPVETEEGMVEALEMTQQVLKDEQSSALSSAAEERDTHVAAPSIPQAPEQDTDFTHLDSIDALNQEGAGRSMDASFEALGKPLEDKGTVRTIFGVAQAKQDTLPSTTTPFGSHVSSPFGSQPFAFGSSFGQFNAPQAQPRFETSKEKSSVGMTSEQDTSLPTLDTRPSFSQPTFGQSSFGQTSFTPFNAFSPPQLTLGSAFASYSTSTNAFASLAQQSSQEQPREGQQQQQEQQEQKPPLPSSFTTFRD